MIVYLLLLHMLLMSDLEIGLWTVDVIPHGDLVLFS